jgi:hypothetical protein
MSADMPLLEIDERQPDQVVQQAPAHLEVQSILHDKDHSGAQRAGRDLDCRQPAEADARPPPSGRM